MNFNRSKYGNKKTEIDGIKFDSKLEAEYYQLLKIRKKTGLIKDFRLQPKFTLQESFKTNDKAYRAINYIADFEIEKHDGSKVIVDCKGLMTEVFKIKAKLFTMKYGELYLVKKTKQGLTIEIF